MLRQDARGSTNLQFVLVTLPFLAASFASYHFLLISRANVVVKHAAARAARSAAVVLDDQEDHYGGEARGTTEGARHEAILEEARAPLAVLAPSDGIFDGKSLGALLPNDGERRAQAERWNAGAVQVSFPASEGATSFMSAFGANDQVTVRVTFLYPCALPLIDFGCRDLDNLGLPPEEMPNVGLLPPGTKVWVFQEDATLPNQGADYEYGGTET